MPLRVPRTRRQQRRCGSCERDEGGPLGAGDQELAPNHCELLSLRAMVVSVAGKGGTRSRQVRSERDERKRTADELPKFVWTMSKPGGWWSLPG